MSGARDREEGNQGRRGVIMAKKSFFVEREDHEGKVFWRLKLNQTGSVPIVEIEAELASVSMKHALPPEGGLYMEAMMPKGNQLGGIYVQAEKRDEVILDLRNRGYNFLGDIT